MTNENELSTPRAGHRGRFLRRHLLRSAACALVTTSAFVGCSGSDQASLGVPSESPSSAPVGATARQVLPGHLAAAFSSAPIIGRLAGETPMTLTLGVGIADQAAFDADVASMSEPTSPNYRHYLTLEQLADRYGASAADYERVLWWARSKNLEATAQADRLFVSLRGAASDVEQAFGVQLHEASRPDGTRFYAPDREPSVDLDLPIRHVSHLDDYLVMRTASATPPAGDLVARDMRNAYASGSLLTGAGQSVGIWGSYGDAFKQSDITAYNQAEGITANPVQINGTPAGGDTQIEVTMDINAAQSMAPSAQIVVFYGSVDTIITNMSSSSIKQFSCSFFPSLDTAVLPDLNLATGLASLAAQGKSFYTASGDSGADVPNASINLADVRSQNYVTSVGGTNLYMSGSTYNTETVWGLSQGGVLSGPTAPTGAVPIPSYQSKVRTSSTQVSSAYRNYPDVSALASSFGFVFNDAGVTIGGTSLATPTWAGFTALANQLATSQGHPTVGFVNPALYAIADQSPAAYAANFHDVQSGTSTNSTHPTVTNTATAGYDLATGLGTPTYTLLSTLAAYSVAPASLPGAPRCTFTAVDYNAVDIACPGDGKAADNSIFTFELTNNTWQPFYSVIQPGVTQGIAVPGGTSVTLLGCTANPAWGLVTPNPAVGYPYDDAPVSPGALGCDAQSTTIESIACVPTGCAGRCGSVTDGCGNKLSCGACPTPPPVTGCGTAQQCCTKAGGRWETSPAPAHCVII